MNKIDVKDIDIRNDSYRIHLYNKYGSYNFFKVLDFNFFLDNSCNLYIFSDNVKFKMSISGNGNLEQLEHGVMHIKDFHKYNNMKNKLVDDFNSFFLKQELDDNLVNKPDVKGMIIKI